MKCKASFAALLAASMLLTVSATALAQGPEQVMPIKAPAPVVSTAGAISVEGTVEYVDLEGGYYAVNGYGLIGDSHLFASLRGQSVIVRGKEFSGVSIRMVKQLEVSMVGQRVAAGRPLPAAITVGGSLVVSDQGPVVENGVLMVPLRAVVETAGGTVEWDDATQSIAVSMLDRKVFIVVGENKAEVNERGRFYIQRNLQPMAAAPVVRGGRTLISADALSRILGLIERADLDGNLDLVAE